MPADAHRLLATIAVSGTPGDERGRVLHPCKNGAR
jgi:hypothetical protein